MRDFFPALKTLFIFYCIFTFAAPPAGAAEKASYSGGTVLIYHRFGEDKYPTTNIAADRFREQLVFLRDNHYRVISLEQLVHSLKQKTPLPDRAVVITIDDGYKSVYESAWPLLKEFGYPFTVFLYIKATDNRHWNYLTWDQVREMKGAGVDFQNHGYAHEHMASKPDTMDMQEYRAMIHEDLTVSTGIFLKELGEQPLYFAVPYGEYNRTVLEEVRSFGYEAILLQDPGSVSGDTDPFAIPREPILGNDWSTMEHFRMVLDRVDLPISDEIPPLGRLSDSTPKTFSARLLYPERYLPGTLGIYVSELGWQKAEIDGDVAAIANTVSLKRRINRVAISGREKESGRTAIRYWMLVGE